MINLEISKCRLNIDSKFLINRKGEGEDADRTIKPLSKARGLKIRGKLAFDPFPLIESY